MRSRVMLLHGFIAATDLNLASQAENNKFFVKKKSIIFLKKDIPFCNQVTSFANLAKQL